MMSGDDDLANEGRINQLGGVFLNGRPLPFYKRRMMVELSDEGMRPSEISRILKVSSGCVSKILGRFQRTGLVDPKASGGSRPRLLTPGVVSIIASHKRQNPALFAWEIRQKLASDQVCRGNKVPSISSINRILKKLHLDGGIMTVQGNVQRVVTERVLEQIQQVDVHSLTEAKPLQYPAHRRTLFTSHQCERLEKEFICGAYPDLLAREKLSGEIKLSPNIIKVWFSNRRAKMRREVASKVRGSVGLTRPWLLESRNALKSFSSTSAHNYFNKNIEFSPSNHFSSPILPGLSHHGKQDAYRPVSFKADGKIFMDHSSPWISTKL